MSSNRVAASPIPYSTPAHVVFNPSVVNFWRIVFGLMLIDFPDESIGKTGVEERKGVHVTLAGKRSISAAKEKVS